jgi:hypothetical protein
MKSHLLLIFVTLIFGSRIVAEAHSLDSLGSSISTVSPVISHASLIWHGLSAS